MEAFIGTILPWAMTWAPEGWFPCDGRQLSQSQYQAVYSLIGTIYGGSGTISFNLPDLRGRVPVGMDLNAVHGILYQAGAVGGHTTVNTALSILNLPQHNHPAAIGGAATGTLPKMSGSLNVSANAGTTNTPSDTNVPSKVPDIMAPAARQILAYGPADTSTKWPVDIQGGSGGTIQLTLSNASVTIGPTGQGVPFVTDVRQPYQVINYIFCIQGLYPTRP